MTSKTEPVAERNQTQAVLEPERESPAEMPEDESYRAPHIGMLLKQLRGDTTLREVHRQTGISLAHLSTIENGSRRPGVSVLRRLAEFHGVDVTDLLERAGHLSSEPADLEEDEETEIERVYRFVLEDRRVRGLVKPQDPTLDTMRFIIELYEKITGKNLL